MIIRCEIHVNDSDKQKELDQYEIPDLEKLIESIIKTAFYTEFGINKDLMRVDDFQFEEE